MVSNTISDILVPNILTADLYAGTEQEETQSSQLPFSNSSLGTLIFRVHFHSHCVLYHALETPPVHRLRRFRQN